MTDAEITSLKTARSNYVQQIVELSDPCRRKVSYSMAGRSVSWTEYQSFLREQVRELDAMIAAAGGDADAVDVIVTAVE